MRPSLPYKKQLVAIFVPAGFALSLRLSQPAAEKKFKNVSDKEAEKMALQGIDKMMDGKIAPLPYRLFRLSSGTFSNFMLPWTIFRGLD